MASRSFRFVGDPDEDSPLIPDEISVFGIVFKKGRPKAVPDSDLAERLAANNHFEEVNRSVTAEAGPSDSEILAADEEE